MIGGDPQDFWCVILPQVFSDGCLRFYIPACVLIGKSVSVNHAKVFTSFLLCVFGPRDDVGLNPTAGIFAAMRSKRP